MPARVQNNSDARGQPFVAALVPGSQSQVSVPLLRQCGQYTVQVVTQFSPLPPAPTPSPAAVCAQESDSVTLYLRSAPADPSAVNATAIDADSVSVAWALTDTGGCAPVTFRLQLFTASREELADLSVTFSESGPSYPTVFAYSFNLPPPQVLPTDTRLFVGVTASTDGGTSLPGSSQWFLYAGPVRLPPQTAALLALAVLSAASLAAAAVCCVYRRFIAPADDPHAPPTHQPLNDSAFSL